MKKTPTYKYVHLTDYEKRAAGLGKPPGRTTIRVELLRDGVAKTEEELATEIQTIKSDMKKRNDEFLIKSTGSTVRPLTTHDNTIKYTAVAEFNQIPEVLRDIKYDDLVLVLDKGTGNTGCIFGSSKRGKTYALMHIFRKYYSKTPTAGDESGTIPFLFAKNIQIDAYKDKKLIKSDSFRADVIKAQHRVQKNSKNEFEFSNFIDDFINLKQNLTLDDLILTYRNSLISTYICLQYVNTLSKAARSNVNNVLLFGQNTDEAAESCVNVYLASWFKSLKVPTKDWVPLFHKVTADHGFFHVHPSTGTVRICKLN